MPPLNSMPNIIIDPIQLARWGGVWSGTISSGLSPKSPDCFDKKQGMDFGKTLIDPIFASSISSMLGNIPVLPPINKNALLPPIPDCVELGDSRIIGGIRPQNFDIVYRPDGVRIAYDSKTLNDINSVKKNWQNMINDLAAEAATVHFRFPLAVVIFVICIPRPALLASQQRDIIRTLERLSKRQNPQDQNHLAEVISLIIWDPATGMIDTTIPEPTSVLRIDKFHTQLEAIYLERYQALPPHI